MYFVQWDRTRGQGASGQTRVVGLSLSMLGALPAVLERGQADMRVIVRRQQITQAHQP